MIIYNANKEFIGIDESYLKVFGLSNLAELRAQAADFADLFVKTPGCIHNFKHVHWIDFITCGESFEKPKVIINVNAKTYTAKITINTFYLVDSPSSKAYAVILNDLRALSSKEADNISDELLHKPSPTPVTEEKFTPPPEPVKERVIPESYSIDIEDEDSYDDYNQAKEVLVPSKQESVIEDKIQLPDMELEQEERLEEEFVEEELLEYADETFDSDYVFDPKVASSELGLPVDLIEEFIEDFIAQAKDFKEDLYASLSEGDIDNVKILSHKLKGVAANLRVEDAFNHLSVVNTSTDTKEIELELNSFYKIISKLAGEEIAPRMVKVSKPKVEAVDPAPEIKEPEPLPNIDFAYDIENEDVPQKIDLPELANVEDVDPEPVSSEKPITLDEDESDALVLEFKEEVPQNVEETLDVPESKEPELLPNMDFAYDIEDEDVPQKIDLPELADDEFLAVDVKEDMKLDLIDDISIVETKEETEKPSFDEKDFLLDEAKGETQEEDLDLEFIEEKVIEDDVEPTIERVPEPIVVEYPKKQIAGEIGLDMETFNELLEDYVTDTNSLLSSMKEALSKDDFTQCKKDVLVLKGMSDSMHVKAIENEIECLMNSSDKKEMTDAIDTIDNVVEQISK